jgi:hypothetical protein
MALAYYMDEHVPTPITIGLRIRGVDVITVQGDGRDGVDDVALLDRATELGRVMFFFDADMARETSLRQQTDLPWAGLVFAHPTQISIGACVRDLELLAQLGTPEDLQNQIIYLPL